MSDKHDLDRALGWIAEDARRGGLVTLRANTAQFLVDEVRRLQGMIEGLAVRRHGQSELLSKRAEAGPERALLRRLVEALDDYAASEEEHSFADRCEGLARDARELLGGKAP